MTTARITKAAVLGAAVLALTGARSAEPAKQDWSVYAGNAAGQRYSPLRQVTPANVAHLKEAWRFETGPGGLQFSPIMVDGVLYVGSPDQSVIALDPATGRQLWRYAPAGSGFQPVRGITYWTEGRERRIFGSAGHYLYAIDATTGKAIASFGTAGRIDLRQGLGRDPETLGVFLTTPGIVYRDLLITGFRTGEGKPAAPGAVRAFDVRSGQLRWTFRTIPDDGAPGAVTWPAGAAKTAGGANNWAGMALDEQRGIVYVPTGSAVSDFYGADRRGDNLYANSLLALDAATGSLVWHFQTVHHDIWDRDLSAPPSLLTLVQGGRRIDAVAQAGKQGVLFLFDRATGRPLFPIDERRVPASDVPGEHSSPTQPFPRMPGPFARQVLTQDMLTKRNPAAHAAAVEAFHGMRSDGPFTPLGVGRKTVIFPGYDGGAEWGGAAVDPGRGIIYLNAQDVPSLGGLHKNGPNPETSPGRIVYDQYCAACHGPELKGAPPDFPRLTDIALRGTRAQATEVMAKGRGRMPGFPQLTAAEREAVLDLLFPPQASEQARMAAAMPPAMLAEFRKLAGGTGDAYQFTGYEKFRDPDGYPAVVPPWGTLNAIDLNTGTYLWRVPLGEYPELVAAGRGVTGSENYGGPLLTATRLLFIGATIFDRKFRAFDARNGRILWETQLPYAGVASPITYAANGRQFIVIAASSSRDPKGPQGSAYIAYALYP